MTTIRTLAVAAPWKLAAAMTLCSLFLIISPANGQDMYSYIIRAPLGGRPAQYSTNEQWYLSLISQVAGPAVDAKQRLLYTYTIVYPGFSAFLTDSEKSAMQQITTVTEDFSLILQTTRTPAFLSLNSAAPLYSATSAGGSGPLWSASQRGKGIIIGFLDTGIWPERASFNDRGYSAIPRRWKGTCEFNTSSICNRKLIGARAFYKGAVNTNQYFGQAIDFGNPRDVMGHGTHGASVAAGSAVSNASLLGAAPGTASGMAPRSRIAIYKVCWISPNGICMASDVFAGFEAAILDGVDIISAPLAGYQLDYHSEPLSLASFAAAARGVLTVLPSGNFGSFAGHGGNLAPWVLTVGGGTLDRRFAATVTLGNGATYSGQSTFAGDGVDRLDLIYAGSPEAMAPGATDNFLAGCCHDASLLNHDVVKGKIVLCDFCVWTNALVVAQAGGAGMIVANMENAGEEVALDNGPPMIPSSYVGHAAGKAIMEYIGSTSRPTASIKKQETKVGIKPAPLVLENYSGQGPNKITPELPKPDVIAPALNVLAAFTGAVGPSGFPADTRRVEFNVMSGTSIASSHAAGVAALLKAARPKWSHAAIRSALMTTAIITDNAGRAIADIYNGAAARSTTIGSGHINPNAALNPGLVYDLTMVEYLHFLCSINYTDSMLYTFTAAIQTNKELLYSFCSRTANNRTVQTPGNLNYPAFSIVYSPNDTSSIVTANKRKVFRTTLSRTVSNVGDSKSTYTVSVKPPSFVNVTVTPSTLVFKSKNQKLSYSVTFSTPVGYIGGRNVTFGSLTWVDSRHGISVRSPITFIWSLEKSLE